MSASAVKLWGRPTSTCTERVLWGLTEAGRSFDLTLASGTMGPAGPVGLGHAPYGGVDTPAYLAMNPNGTVPTIDDGGFALWDSIAILVYLATSPGPARLADARTLATAVQWMSWANEYLEPPLHTLVMHLVRLPEAQRDSAAVAAAKARLRKPLGILDAHLAANAYLCGEGFTLGDIPCGVSYHRWRVFEPDAPLFPHIEAWRERLMTRDGFRTHVAPPGFHLTGR